MHVHAMSFVADGKNAAMFDVVAFSEAMLAAVRRWYAANGSDPQVVENLKSLIRTCPYGLPPFIEAGPVVASGE